MDLTSISAHELEEIVTDIGADRASLFLQREDSRHRPELAARLFDVQPGCDLTDVVMQDDSKRQLHLPLTRGVIGYVARTKRLIVVNEPAASRHFEPDVDRQTGFRTESLMAAPLIDANDRLIGVVEVLNKLGANEERASNVVRTGPRAEFDTSDREKFASCTRKRVIRARIGIG